MREPIRFEVRGLPPRKGAVSSMWNKKASRAQKHKLIALRKAALAAIEAHGDKPFLGERIRLTLYVHIECREEGENPGDLDNFVTGVCDGLVAAKEGTRPDDCFFHKRDDAHNPWKPIAFGDDHQIEEICAKKVVAEGEDWYRVELEELKRITRLEPNP